MQTTQLKCVFNPIPELLRMAILCLQVVVGQGEAAEMGLRYNGKYNGTTLNTFYTQLF